MVNYTVTLPWDGIILATKDESLIRKYIAKYIKDDDINMMYLHDVLRNAAEEINASKEAYYLAQDVLKDMPGEELTEYLVDLEKIHTGTADKDLYPEWVRSGVVLTINCKFDDKKFIKDMEQVLEEEIEQALEEDALEEFDLE